MVVAVVVVLLLRNHGGPAVTALVLFAVVQIVILEVAITFFDAGVDLDTREFIPVYAAVVMALACGVSRRRPVQVVTVLLVVACALRFGIDEPLPASLVEKLIAVRLGQIGRAAGAGS